MADGLSAGNRWFKVNLHVHGEGNDPAEIVRSAREAEIDVLAITDHQSFNYCDQIIAAANGPGRRLIVLPGIEITSHEGVHVIAIFPQDFGITERTLLLGWLEITGSGDTKVACKKNLADIFDKIRENGGVVIVPHPFTTGIGMLDSARKMSTKVEWLESGQLGLIQVPEDKVQYVGWDEEGNWMNRYVLATATSGQIKSSNYCLAPFNRSDAHKPEEIAAGCSWFRMSEASVEGLRQVCCEPKTRISRALPPPLVNNTILAMRVCGGYSDGQFFQFNGALNCIVGQNYAGKSAVFDFIRFGLGLEETIDQEIRAKLLTRLYGILGHGGNVELFLRAEGSFYAVRRGFNPSVVGSGPNLTVQCCPEKLIAYRFDPATDSLIPSANFTFPVEVYEQHRISRLRDDMGRQLEMLDEFAALGELKRRRSESVSELELSAQALAPLYEERERLKGEIANLSQLQQELEAKEKLMPGKEEQKWAKASAFVHEAEALEKELSEVSQEIPLGPTDYERTADLERLFGQAVPSFKPDDVVRADLLAQWRENIQTALTKIEASRAAIIAAINAIASGCKTIRGTWQQEEKVHKQALGATLRQAGVESPEELIARIGVLRRQVGLITTQKQPRLATVNASIDQKEHAREKLLSDLEQADTTLSSTREGKGKELTEALDGKIKIEVKRAEDRVEYQRVLTDLCNRIATRDSQIKNKESQLAHVVSKLTPLQLARALRKKGTVETEGGRTLALTELCDITQNTQNFLCRLADDILLLSKLETVAAPDVLQILVQRRGEETFADLRTGLSPGEQSAAILTLALQTRSMPLIVDQPEDELGYSYVVHLIVPKLLQAKFSRQILVVTHNANIPVLGDSDYVIKMENRPGPNAGRRCVVAEAGGFESATVTKALVELEGGKRAFDFRRFRYTMPRNNG